MSNKLHESLSALMDNEADELEIRRLLKEMDEVAQSQSNDSSSDSDSLSDLKAKWSRYHVLSASCKQEIHTSPSCDLLSRINAELENEVLPIAERTLPLWRSGSGKGIFQFIGQGAIAASVALAVLFTADMMMVADNGSGTDSGAELAGNEAVSKFLPGLTGELNPATETRVAVQTDLDPEEMSRLQQVVSEELEDTLEIQKVPATFVPENAP